MARGYSLDGHCIVINRELTDLDIFLKDFLKVLKKYSDYLVVSGFVSISTGRTRATEDIDVLFSKLVKDQFSSLFKGLTSSGFWCYQGESAEEAYKYVKDYSNLRFARTNEVFPNIELIPVDKSRKLKYFEFTRPQKIRLKNFEFNIPPLEFEILYKEVILAGKKDMEDARHLRTFFSDVLKEENFKIFEKIIRENEERN